MNNLHESTLSRQQASSSFQKNDFVAFYQVLSEQKGEGSWVCTFFLFNLVLLLFTLMKAIAMSYYLRNIFLSLFPFKICCCDNPLFESNH